MLEKKLCKTSRSLLCVILRGNFSLSNNSNRLQNSMPNNITEKNMNSQVNRSLNEPENSLQKILELINIEM